MKPDLVRVYGDESRQTQHRYMLQGTLWIPDAYHSDFDKDCDLVRQNHNIFGHMKWTKVSAGKYNAYRDFVDVFFRYMRTGKASFRAIIVDTHQLDHQKYNQGDEELGFYKFYYQLLLQGTDPKNNYHITLAHRENKVGDRLPALKTALNNGVRKKHLVGFDCVRAVEPKAAKDSNHIQVADLLMGAVGYHIHDLHCKEGASGPRCELAAHIARQVGKPNLKFQSLPSESRFNIWHIRLKK